MVPQDDKGAEKDSLLPYLQERLKYLQKQEWYRESTGWDILISEIECKRSKSSRKYGRGYFNIS